VLQQSAVTFGGAAPDARIEIVGGWVGTLVEIGVVPEWLRLRENRKPATNRQQEAGGPQKHRM
jgi:hypothetical protein